MEWEYNIKAMWKNRVIFFLIRCICSLVIFWGCFLTFYIVNTGSLYIEYANLWDYRRLHPEFEPQEKLIRIFDAGHTTTYADFLWMSMVQYIADNIGNGKYIDYTYPLLDTISRLHPHFTRSYTLALLLTPSLDPNNPNHEKNVKIGEKAFAIGQRGILENCETSKVNLILSSWVNVHPWDRTDLRNPCSDGFIAYYLGYVADGIGKRSLASRYYALASANDDAPKASRFLSIIMEGKAGDRINAAIQFFLIAISGYDESPYLCQHHAEALITLIWKNKNITPKMLGQIQSYEKEISAPKDMTNPLASNAMNCYASMNRGIKQSYLGYITDSVNKSPNILNGSGIVLDTIISKWILPFPKWYDGYSIQRMDDGSFEYRKFYK